MSQPTQTGTYCDRYYESWVKLNLYKENIEDQLEDCETQRKDLMKYLADVEADLARIQSSQKDQSITYIED